MISFGEYQQKARSLAAYPELGKGLLYPALGLAGEAGEAADKVKKIWRNTGVKDGNAYTPEQKEALKLELGDVMWYCANLSSELGLNLEEVAEANLAKLFSRKDRGVLKSEGDNR
jgi:NTP pyrophosphatase (non-canonical NTP hydrolase)